MAKNRIGIQPTSGRLSKQIARTRKLSFPDGDAVKYWFCPPPPPPVDPSNWSEDKDEVVDTAIDEPWVPKKARSADKSTYTKTEAPAAPKPGAPSVPAISPDAHSSKTQDAPTVPETYPAFVVTQDNNDYASEIKQLPIEGLPTGEVLIRVDYSSLNHKDALAAIGDQGVAGKFPLVPGIDAAGVVAESPSPIYQPGDEVLVTGFDLGTHIDGGFGRYIHVPSDWIVRCPEGLSLKEAMGFGTAGFTAAQSVNELERNGVGPRSGEVLVTDAGGGVGCIAVALLTQVGFDVVAVADDVHRDFLLELGATEVLDREELMARNTDQPLHDSRWAGVIDTVGGEVMEIALKEAQYGAAITCCGMLVGTRITTSVYPFIMRSVRLIGIDSAYCPIPLRNRLWRRMANEWKLDKLGQIMRERSLTSLEGEIEKLLAGNSIGRIVIKHEG